MTKYPIPKYIRLELGLDDSYLVSLQYWKFFLIIFLSKNPFILSILRLSSSIEDVSTLPLMIDKLKPGRVNRCGN